MEGQDIFKRKIVKIGEESKATNPSFFHLLQLLLRDRVRFVCLTHACHASCAARRDSSSSLHSLPDSAIITSKLTYIFFRPHRFVFNFGYGFDNNDDIMSPVGFIFASLFLELAFELLIDVMALQVEAAEGIDLDEFWEMWRESESSPNQESAISLPHSRMQPPPHCSPDPYAFSGLLLSDAVVSLYVWGFITFMITPTPSECSSNRCRSSVRKNSPVHKRSLLLGARRSVQVQWWRF